MNQIIINNKRVGGNKKGSRTIIISALLLLSIFAIAGNDLAVNKVSAQTSPTLGTAGSYSVLAGTTVTNSPTCIGPCTHVTGDLGVWSGSAVTGFPPGTVGGTIHAGDSTAQGAQSDLGTAFTSLDTLNTCTSTFPADQDLTLLSPLGPGVYCDNGPTGFSLSGTLILSGSGVWVFKSAKQLVTASNSKIVGGDPCNVWWREGSSATLGTGTQLIGNILAYASITLNTGATLNGRALAQTGQVSLDSNAVDGPTCATGTTTITTTVISGTTTTPTTITILMFASFISAVGGYLQPINKAEVLSMMLSEGASSYWWVLAITAILAVAGVLLKRRES